MLRLACIKIYVTTCFNKKYLSARLLNNLFFYLIMGFWDGFFKKNGKEKSVETQANHQYPLEELGKLVGQLIEVYYIDRDEERLPEKATLRFPPCHEHFYIGSDSGYHIIHWERIDMDGKKFAVRLIKDSEGKVIYDNPHVPYNFNKLKEQETKQNNPEPSDTLSHAPEL